MSEKTNISWCHSTWSPWLGCRKVSPGCANCYITTTTPFRTRKLKHGEPRQRTSENYWKQPVKWDKAHRAWRDQPCDPKFRPAVDGHPNPRIFPSLCDWLDDEVPIEWLADFLKLIHDTPNLNWLLLSKRPELFRQRLLLADSIAHLNWVLAWLSGTPPPNVWIGVSVEDQKRANERIPLLLQIPAKVRFLSVEPLLSHVDLTFPGGGQTDTPYNLRGNFWEVACENHCTFAGRDDALIPDPTQSNKDAEMNGTIYVCPKCHCESGLVYRSGDYPNIDWVIVGGESGQDRRDCGVEAICDVANQCRSVGVPCYVKQDCAVRSGQQGRIPAETWAMKEFPK